MRFRTAFSALIVALAMASGSRADLDVGGGMTDFSSTLFAVAPAHPTSDRAVQIEVSVLELPLGPIGCPDVYWNLTPVVDQRLIEIRLEGVDCPSAAAAPRATAGESWSRVRRNFSVGPLPVGVYTLRLVLVDSADRLPLAETRFEVVAPGTGDPTLALHGGRFLVTLERQLPGGTTASAAAVRFTDDAGYFWFFDAGNVELTVKILDGRPVNGHFWVFAASMTDRPYTLTVMDTAHDCLLLPVSPPACPTRRYTALSGGNQNVIDVSFPTE